MLKKITTICLLIYISVFVAKTQNIDKNKIILVSKISEFIQADGFLNESIWLKIEPVGGFWEHFPSDSIRPEKNTEVKIAYDTEFLYIAAICYDRRVSPIVQSLTRDDNGGFWASDAFSFTIDPLNTQKSGYFFGLNAGGAEIDALVTQRGANPVFDNNWSSKWFSGVQVIDDGISYEFKIPLSIFNFDSNNKEWGINFMRNDTEDYNKFITWTQFPMMYDARDLNYLGRIEFESDINSSNDRFVLMPGISLKIDDDETPGLVKSKLKYGLDAKIKLSSTTNMDLMIIPDFSNANVDKDYIDFNRYEYFMNEQRTFFLENGDLFFDYGDSDFRPIYTRRIGIHNWNDYTIWAGGIVTGKLNKGFDFGILSIQTDAYEELPSQNFSIAAHNCPKEYIRKKAQKFQILKYQL